MNEKIPPDQPEGFLFIPVKESRSSYLVPT